MAGEYADTARRGRSKLRSGRALEPLLGYLREFGAVPPAVACVPQEPVDVLLTRFGGWLSDERGLVAPATVSSYLHQARPFAVACAGQLPVLTAARVSALATEGAAGLRPRSAQVRANAVRALLRFAWLEGLTAVPLAGAVGSFAAPAGAAPPKGLSPGQACDFLAFVRAGPGGLRNEPMMALLLRLALRAGEAASLLLDDIAWRQGVITVRGKGNRADQVPMPTDVGGPLARYLGDGRPARTAHRQVFLALDAPYAPLDAVRGDERNRGMRRARGRRRARRGRPAAAPCRPGGDCRLRQVRYHGAALDRPAVAGRRTAMSVDLRAAIGARLAARRARGYRLDGHEHLLGAFLDSLEARGETRITVPAALAFAAAPARTARVWHAQRLAAVRSFAGYVHGLDPAAADPVPDGLIPARAVRRIPYLYSGEETARLMTAAAALSPPILAASMRTLIGLAGQYRHVLWGSSPLQRGSDPRVCAAQRLGRDLTSVAQDEVGAGIADAGGGELVAERGEGLGAPGRGERVEPDEQLAGAGADVAGDGQCLADQRVGLVAGAGVVAVQGAGQGGFGVIGGHPDGVGDLLGLGVQADHVRGEGAERDPGRDGRRGRVRFL